MTSNSINLTQEEQILFNKHTKVIYFLSKKYKYICRHYGLTLLDIKQMGSIGLCKAIRTFDPSKGQKFITYASYKIQHTIIDLLREICGREDGERHKFNLSLYSTTLYFKDCDEDVYRNDLLIDKTDIVKEVSDTEIREILESHIVLLRYPVNLVGIDWLNGIRTIDTATTLNVTESMVSQYRREVREAIKELDYILA